MSVKIQFRAPKTLRDTIADIARNKKVKPSELYREALKEYASTYSTIPSLKELWRLIESHEKRITDLENPIKK